MQPRMNAECVVCKEAITNPICPGCLEKEISYWLLDKRPELMESVLLDITGFGESDNNKTKCIICGEGMDICAHCYCNDIKDILAEHSQELIDDFTLHFDFELGGREAS